MALSKDDYDLLTDLLQAYQEKPDHRKLNDWERKFLDDHATRFEEHGEDMFISKKQREVCRKIWYKLKDCIGPNS